MTKRELTAGVLSVTLAVTLLTSTVSAVSFTDVPAEHWASTYIDKASDLGVMSGVGDSKFAPGDTLTCAEFVTILVRAFYEDEIVEGLGGPWYASFMVVAESKGLLAGVQSSTEETITRYDMAQLMYNVMKDKGLTMTKLVDTSKVADWSSIPAAYQEAVSVCYNMGMLAGVDDKGTFDGEGVMDRAQAAVVINQLVNIPTPEPAVATPAEIPAGAVALTSSNAKVKRGSFQADGSVVLECNGLEACGGLVKFTNTGYSKITFTVTTRTWLHSVAVLGADSMVESDVRLLAMQEAGVTEAYTVDISGITSIELQVRSGRKSDATVSNIYLY